MRNSFLIPFGAMTLLLASCGLVRDTPAHHAVHKGELATLSPKHNGAVWIATDRSSSEELNQAFESGDRGTLAALERTGKAFQVEKGAQVQVIGERYNDRHVRILSANQANKTGWVPYEWLQPVTKAQQ